MARLLVMSGLVVILAAGCTESPPTSPAPPGTGVETITGRERFGWLQAASSATELATYQYAVYVDGSRRVLEGTTCATTGSAAGFECSAPLPPLTPGRRTLELAAVVAGVEGPIEGARSDPLHVMVVGATAPAPVVEAGTFTTPDGLRLAAAVLADDLLDPVDLAVTGDGRVFVAERAGRIRVFGDSRDHEAGGSVLDLFRRVEDAELLSMAVAPDFARTALLYVAFGATDNGEPVLHVARVREARGIMAEAALLSSHPVPADATALIRLGPDRHLFAGIGTGAAPDDAQKLSAAGGKILRLRDDGRTPEDNPWSSPVWSAGHRDPRGLAWHPEDHTLWEVERDEHGDELNTIRPGANYGWPIIRGPQAHPQVSRPALVLPAGTDVSGIAAVALPSSPLYGNLIVSARGGQELLRIRPGSGRRQQPTSPLLQGRFGHIGQVASGPDGAIYVITANAHVWGAGNDVLVRLTPASPAATRSDRR